MKSVVNESDSEERVGGSNNGDWRLRFFLALRKQSDFWLGKYV